MLKKKICMLGHFGVGKTSLVRRFVESAFDDRYLTTLGVKIDRKDVTVEGKGVTLMLWDIAGEDDLAQVKLSHVRGASGYILVADGCRAQTLATAIDLRQKVETSVGQLPFVLAINKADLRNEWEVTSEEAQAQGWMTFETSAKSGQGVEEMFATLAEQILAQAADEEILEA